LELLDEKNNKISETLVSQVNDSDIDTSNAIIFELALSKNGWLWVDGYEADYITHIDLNVSPPIISEPIELTKFTNTQCTRWWFSNCFKTQGTYSHVLESIFVSKRSLLGLFPPINIIIKDGIIRPFPKELNSAAIHDEIVMGSQEVHFSDVPMLNGLLFRGEDDQPIFYDGKKTKWLPLPRIYLGDTYFWGLKSSPYNKATILIVSPWFRKSRHIDNNYYFQINSDLSLTQLTLLGIANDDVSQFGAFWIGKHGIYVKRENRLRPILNVPPQVNLWKYDYIEKAPTEKIVFEAINYVTNRSRDYFIVPLTLTAQCLAKLDPDKAIMLDTPN